MEALFYTLAIIAAVAGVFAVLSLVALFFEWAEDYLDRKMDKLIGEWADHE